MSRSQQAIGTTAQRSRTQGSSAQRFVAMGRPMAQSDGTLRDSLEAQMQGAWMNLFTAMRAAGYEKHHLVQTTVCVTQGGQQQLYRRIRDRMLEGHSAASAYLHVGALSTPADLVEIEGWAEKG